MANKQLTLVITSLLLFLIPKPTQAVSQHQNHLSVTVKPYFIITKIGENLSQITPDSETVQKFTTTYSPLTIIGVSQPNQTINLSVVDLINGQTLYNSSLQSYPDGTFAFSIPDLTDNHNYKVVISAVHPLFTPYPSGSFEVAYQPLSTAITRSQPPILVQKTGWLYSVSTKVLIFIIIALVALVLFVFWFWTAQRLRITLITLNSTSLKPQPLAKLTLIIDNQPYKIIKSNKKAIAKLKRYPAFKFQPDLKPPITQLPPSFLIYQNDYIYIKTNQIIHKNLSVDIEKLQAIVVFV